MIVYAGIALGVLALGTLVLRGRGIGRAGGRNKILAGLNILWGGATLLFSVGGLFAAVIAIGVSALGTLAILLVSLSGFGLGFALLATAERSLHGREIERRAGLGRWAMIHHIAVFGAFTFTSPAGVLGEGGLWQFILVPCVVGLLLGWGLQRR